MRAHHFFVVLLYSQKDDDDDDDLWLCFCADENGEKQKNTKSIDKKKFFSKKISKNKKKFSFLLTFFNTKHNTL